MKLIVRAQTKASFAGIARAAALMPMSESLKNTRKVTPGSSPIFVQATLATRKNRIESATKKTHRNAAANLAAALTVS
jgi:hypothetical protein